MAHSEKMLADIEAFLRESGMSASFFGKAAVGDPNFVGEVRKGRKPHLDLVDRVDGYIKSARERRVDPRTVAEKIAAKIEDLSEEIGKRLAAQTANEPPTSAIAADIARGVLMEWLTGSQAGGAAQLRDIDRPQEFPRRSNKVSGPILIAVLVIATVGALTAFLFLETMDGRLASPRSGIGNPPHTATASHG